MCFISHHLFLLPQSIFNNLQSYEVEHFITFWDFLNKRFFFHLDSEHLNLSGILKTDLIKYYLVYCIKTKNKDKITEFFTLYSHEILAEGGNFIPGNLRNWFVLPYIDEPEKDIEFSSYFTTRWAELLKITLHNFLSVVISSSPPPKLLLLEKWYRSEAQQEIRSQLKQSAKKIDNLLEKIELQEHRLQSLREVIKILSSLLYQIIIIPGNNINLSNTNHHISSTSRSYNNSNNNNNSNNTTSSNSNQTHEEKESELKRMKAKSIGLDISRITTDCLKKSQTLQNLPREERLVVLLGNLCSSIVFQGSNTSAGVPSYYESTTNTSSTTVVSNVSQEEGKGDPGNPLVTVAGKGLMAEINLEELESELIRTVQDWSSILS